MQKRVVLVALVAASIVLAAACGDSTSGEGGAAGTTANTGNTGATKASSSATGNAGSCTQPGDKGNDKGVGEYCTPTGNECAAFPGAPICLAKLNQPEWMCTRVGCDSADDCGMDAGCHKDPAGSACVPCRCDDTAEGCPNGPMGTTSSTSGTGTAASSSTGM